LEKVLSKAWEVNAKVKNAASAFTNVEQFNAVWRSKSGQVSAFKEGSSFLIEISEEVNSLITSVGEWTEQGFGKVQVESFDKSRTYKLDDTQEANEDKDEGDLNLSSRVLKQLKVAYDSEQKDLRIKQQAILAAKRKGANIVKNHLIGRMERLFERSSSDQEIENWIKETQDKPAGDGLKKAGLVDYDHKFKLDPHDKLRGNWDLQKLYWITFFRTLRKLNKKDGKKG
jgi:hypothetical protein